jgi:hypothetical protein
MKYLKTLGIALILMTIHGTAHACLQSKEPSDLDINPEGGVNTINNHRGLVKGAEHCDFNCNKYRTVHQSVNTGTSTNQQVYQLKSDH